MEHTSNNCDTRSVEIDPFLFHHQWPFLHLGINRTDVFPDNANKKELHRTEKEQADNEGRGPQRKLIPKNQFGDEIPHGNKKAGDGHREPQHGGQPQGNLGVIGDSQHGNIIQRVKIVFADSPFSRGLHVFDFVAGKADVGNQSPKIWVRIIDLSQFLDDATVIQAETRAVLEQLDVGNPVDEIVVHLADGKHQGRFFALALHAAHHLEALFPPLQEFLDQ